MERSSKRGKIPQQDWPSIMARHEAGETLASIARTYDCSPPAISYIVSRSRARNAGAQLPTKGSVTAGETQLIKAHTLDSAAVPEPQQELLETPAEAVPMSASPMTPPQPTALRGDSQRSEPRLFADRALRSSGSRDGSRANGEDGSPIRHFPGHPDGGLARAVEPSASFAVTDRPAQNAEARRTLHLSLSHGNGGDPSPYPLPQPVSAAGDRDLVRPVTAGETAPIQPSRQGAVQNVPPNNAAPVRALSDPRKSREGGAIDYALRERVSADIAAFLAAFDTALEHDTQESRAGLREATDRLLRAGARTRIELERLEARVPLPPRERQDQDAVAWRHR
jgi:hypothetical protein